MSSIMKQTATVSRLVTTRDPTLPDVAALGTGPRPTGPSRRRRRANRRLGRAVALCAMSAWVAVGVMPVAAAVYALYGY